MIDVTVPPVLYSVLWKLKTKKTAAKPNKPAITTDYVLTVTPSRLPWVQNTHTESSARHKFPKQTFQFRFPKRIWGLYRVTPNSNNGFLYCLCVFTWVIFFFPKSTKGLHLHEGSRSSSRKLLLAQQTPSLPSRAAGQVFHDSRFPNSSHACYCGAVS